MNAALLAIPIGLFGLLVSRLLSSEDSPSSPPVQPGGALPADAPSPSVPPPQLSEADRNEVQAAAAAVQQAEQEAAAVAQEATAANAAVISAQQSGNAAALASAKQTAVKAAAKQAAANLKTVTAKGNAAKVLKDTLPKVRVQPQIAKRDDQIRVGAKLLAEFLQRNPTVAAFGYRGAPSEAVATFQKIAGLAADGILGPTTRSAATRVGVRLPDRPKPGAAAPRTSSLARNVPMPRLPALPAPQAPQPPPQAAPRAAAPAGFNPAVARQLAQPIADNVRQQKYNYNRQRVAQFQLAAGIPSDGIYGRQTSAAVKFYGGQRTPGALFAQGVDSYTPPAV